MITTFDRPKKTSKNGREYWQILRRKYDTIDTEIRAILSRYPGYTADYIEDQPVHFRTNLIRQIVQKEKEGSDGSGAVKKK